MLKLATLSIPVLSLSLLACGASGDDASNESNLDQAQPPGAATGPAFPDGLHWFRNSAEYQASARQAYRLAGMRADQIAASRPGGAWAVVLDGDETVLDNSQYQKETIGVGYNADTWATWVRRKQAKAIPGASAFTKHVHDLGGKVAIVTNRVQDVCADSEANLRTIGIAYDIILCAESTTATDKNPRFKALAEGTAKAGQGPVEIVLYVGDSITDFPAMTQEVRNGPEAGFSQFADSFIVLPNPMYGGWTKNPSE